MISKKVIIADDHPIFRQGLIRLIERESGFTLVGESRDGAEALGMIRALRPDIAILDLAMPELNGFDVIKAVQQEGLPVDFIILTMYADEEYFDMAMTLQIKGYILKENAVPELHKCLRAVADGKYYICPSLSGFLIERKGKITSLREQTPTIETLTAMERQILRLLADYKSSKEIAVELAISTRTVQNHRVHICQKLGLTGHNKLLQFALEHKTYL